jgi:hypothetical protein
MASPFDVHLQTPESVPEARANAVAALAEPARVIGLRLTKQASGELRYRPRVQFPFLIMGWHYLNGERMTVRFAAGEGRGLR